jgi:hypothetical protein
LLAPASPAIDHTIENQSPQTNQQITTQQISQEHDVETICQSIERVSLPQFTQYHESENLYDSDSDRDDNLVAGFAPQDQLIPSSSDILTTSITLSTLIVHRGMEVPTSPHMTSVVNHTVKAPKGLILAIYTNLTKGLDKRRMATRPRPNGVILNISLAWRR